MNRAFAEETNGEREMQKSRLNKRLFWENFGVADGTRTRDNRNHNPGLYQLSYSHRSDVSPTDASISEEQDYTRIPDGWLVSRTKNFKEA